MVGLDYCVVYLSVLGRPSNLDNRRARVGRACSRCGMGLYFIPDRSKAVLLLCFTVVFCVSVSAICSQSDRLYSCPCSFLLTYLFIGVGRFRILGGGGAKV